MATPWSFDGLPGSMVADLKSKKISWYFRFLEFRITPPSPIKSMSYEYGTALIDAATHLCRHWLVERPTRNRLS